jgi:hypothetical protein
VACVDGSTPSRIKFSVFTGIFAALKDQIVLKPSRAFRNMCNYGKKESRATANLVMHASVERVVARSLLRYFVSPTFESETMQK